jgi:hypothetical protein
VNKKSRVCRTKDGRNVGHRSTEVRAKQPIGRTAGKTDWIARQESGLRDTVAQMSKPHVVAAQIRKM